MSKLNREQIIEYQKGVETVLYNSDLVMDEMIQRFNELKVDPGTASLSMLMGGFSVLHQALPEVQFNALEYLEEKIVEHRNRLLDEADQMEDL